MQGRKGRMAKRFKSIKIYEESYGYLIALKAEAEAETRKNYTLAEAFHALVKSSYDNMLKAKSGRRPADPYSHLLSSASSHIQATNTFSVMSLSTRSCHGYYHKAINNFSCRRKP